MAKNFKTQNPEKEINKALENSIKAKDNYWTKDIFIKKCLHDCNLEGIKPSDKLQYIFEWASNLVEQAYNDGYEAGRQSFKESITDNSQ